MTTRRAPRDAGSPKADSAARRLARVSAGRPEHARDEALSSDDRLLDELARRKAPQADADLVTRLLAALAADADRVHGR